MSVPKSTSTEEEAAAATATEPAAAAAAAPTSRANKRVSELHRRLDAVNRRMEAVYAKLEGLDERVNATFDEEFALFVQSIADAIGPATEGLVATHLLLTQAACNYHTALAELDAERSRLPPHVPLQALQQAAAHNARSAPPSARQHQAQKNPSDDRIVPNRVPTSNILIRSQLRRELEQRILEREAAKAERMGGGSGGEEGAPATPTRRRAATEVSERSKEAKEAADAIRAYMNHEVKREIDKIRRDYYEERSEQDSRNREEVLAAMADARKRVDDLLDGVADRLAECQQRVEEELVRWEAQLVQKAERIAAEEAQRAMQRVLDAAGDEELLRKIVRETIRKKRQKERAKRAAKRAAKKQPAPPVVAPVVVPVPPAEEKVCGCGCEGKCSADYGDDALVVLVAEP